MPYAGNSSTLFNGFDIGFDGQSILVGVTTILMRISPILFLIIGLFVAVFIAHKLVDLRRGEAVEELDGLRSLFDGLKGLVSGRSFNSSSKHTADKYSFGLTSNSSGRKRSNTKTGRINRR
ncbi:hypothetical protein [Dehalobacter sp.]|uniref:hypothetical protein n=1 Tax=Dehalobacter sp. TaxID=1962289 RepID=UPI00036BA604|nr:hypothetical protein [Dehalobacter sp.]MDJ0304553.1 hypothetical protein [Dehalobacter sp.]